MRAKQPIAGRWTRVKPFWRESAALLIAVAGGLVASPALAEPKLGETLEGLPGLVRVGIPVAAVAPVTAGAGVSVGFLDAVGTDSGGMRVAAQGGAALFPIPNLGIGAELVGRLDGYSNSGDRNGANLYGEPRLHVRYSGSATPVLFWGAQLDARLIGADAPSIEWAATTPALRGLVGWHVDPQVWLGLNLGFQWDRSHKAVPNPERMSDADKRSLGASSWNAFLFGIGAEYTLGTGDELFLEVTGEPAFGAGSPGVAGSPLRATLGARRAMTRDIWLAAQVEAALSRRPTHLEADELRVLEPRLSAGLGVIFRIGVPPPAPVPTKPAPVQPKPVAPPAEAVTPPADPAVALNPLNGVVVDEGGHPVADVEVTLAPSEGEPLTTRTNADGTFEFKDAPLSAVQLSFATPGFDSVTLSVADGDKRTHEVTLRTAIPAGQVRGAVLDVRGSPIPARVSVERSAQTAAVAADGSFVLELPPGSYTLRFEADNYRPQKRTIRVRDHGVVILNIALIR